MKKLWISLFAVFVLALGLAPSFFSQEEYADDEVLIISPHWDGIKHEFARGFREYYQKRFNRTVRVSWLDHGATGEINRFLEGRAKVLPPDANFGADILFGGGVDSLPRFADAGIFAPYELSPEQQRDFPADNLGQPLRDPQNRWHSACLSTFGFVYNEPVLQRANLKTPTTWKDLAEPEFQGWVSCGNPTQSGSLHAAFEIVLQGHGWDEGWSILTRLSANARSFNEGGSSVPRDISLGQAAAGPSIDFYATAPVRRQGADHLKLVVPKGQSVATPDGIAILRHPPNAKQAHAFMDFVFSEEGQKLWYLPRGAPGGPVKYDLERLPSMARIYDLGLPTHTMINPFKDKPTFRYDSKKAGARWRTMDDLWRGFILDVHDDLWTTRELLRKNNRRDLDAELGRPPFTEAEVMEIANKKLNADERNALRNKWSAQARIFYADLRAKAGKQ
jgi:ABC-type Fe3+ transport system substrate-binding protein